MLISKFKSFTVQHKLACCEHTVIECVLWKMGFKKQRKQVL